MTTRWWVVEMAHQRQIGLFTNLQPDLHWLDAHCATGMKTDPDLDAGDLRVDEEQETEGLDLISHEEKGYNL